MTTDTKSSTRVPAFRIARGDVVTHERRRWQVAAVTPMVFYPRRRDLPIRHGVRLTVWPVKGGLSSTIVLDNYDLIRRVAV